MRLLFLGLLALTISCKSKPAKVDVQPDTTVIVAPSVPVPAPVEIAPTDSLQNALSALLSAYKTVNGKVENGVITLTGEIKRSQLTTLMQSVNELKPKKVENKLVIK
jgi:hyperosmotically inducible periplasmic protein